MKIENKLTIELPKGFMNCSVTTCNHFIADTNDSKNWDTLKFPLPKPIGEWLINGYNGDKGKFEVELVDQT